MGGPLRRGDGTELLWALIKIVIDIQPTPYRTWYTLRKITIYISREGFHAYKCKFTISEITNKQKETWFGEIPKRELIPNRNRKSKIENRLESVESNDSGNFRSDRKSTESND
jgi:hypothetical protein